MLVYAAEQLQNRIGKFVHNVDKTYTQNVVHSVVRKQIKTMLLFRYLEPQYRQFRN